MYVPPSRIALSGRCVLLLGYCLLADWLSAGQDTAFSYSWHSQPWWMM